MLLTELYPRCHHRYASLPILGSVLEGYAAFLFDLGYPRHRVRQHFRTARRLARRLQKLGVQRADDLTRDRLHACAPASSQDDRDLTVLVRLLDRYLEAVGVFDSPQPTKSEAQVATYGTYLEEVRGFAPSTVTHHSTTVAEFLDHLSYEENPSCLIELHAADVEAFVAKIGSRLSRASLQHSVSHLRSFLRFLAAHNETPPGLDGQIDTPRVYRGERLPRSLPWETVCTLLRSIDRSTPMGRRDFAMLLLIATYGLRTCEVVTLTLDNIDWRSERISVAQRKTAHPLILPLTAEVGGGLVDYLQHGRPPLRYREVFLRCRAPDGVLKPTAVTEAFQAWSARSGLDIRFQGPHCLRHSYAVRLLRQGTSLKTIGDVLGHRSAESTCVYLRLAIDDLRAAALPLPRDSTSRAAEEVPS